MATAPRTLRFGTRGSDLALWQTKYIMGLLQEAVPAQPVEYEIIRTRGDEVLDMPLPLIGGKGVFTAELEFALHERRIDCAVHSLKDLPTSHPGGLVIGAIPTRENPADVLISRDGYTLNTLPHGARIGTSSYRRTSQLLHLRPDLKMLDLRGNVDTRIRKALDAGGDYDAIVLAYAGVKRLGLTGVVNQIFDLEAVLPAPGQGAIAVQVRDDPELLAIFERIGDQQTALAVTAERGFLAELGGGCSVPVSSYGRWRDGQLLLRGRVSALDGVRQIDVQITAPAGDMRTAHDLGTALAQKALAQGARELMEQQS